MERVRISIRTCVDVLNTLGLLDEFCECCKIKEKQMSDTDMTNIGLARLEIRKGSIRRLRTPSEYKIYYKRIEAGTAIAYMVEHEKNRLADEFDRIINKYKDRLGIHRISGESVSDYFKKISKALREDSIEVETDRNGYVLIANSLNIRERIGLGVDIEYEVFNNVDVDAGIDKDIELDLSIKRMSMSELQDELKVLYKAYKVLKDKVDANNRTE